MYPLAMIRVIRMGRDARCGEPDVMSDTNGRDARCGDSFSRNGSNRGDPDVIRYRLESDTNAANGALHHEIKGQISSLHHKPHKRGKKREKRERKWNLTYQLMWWRKNDKRVGAEAMGS